MHYYIRQQGTYVYGPHDIEHVRAWIKQGKVRPEMEFSADREDWAWGYELVELFPPDHKSRRTSRRAV